jgi:adenosylhomocysteine nucleosidase
MDMCEQHNKKVAILAALEREVRLLIRGWRLTERDYEGRRFRFFENNGAVAVCGGIGSEAARRAAEAVIAIYAPTLIYSVGFAGALEARWKVGDVIRPSQLIDAADGSRVGLSGGEGVLISFGSVATPTQKQKLHESFGAQLVDMEAAAVARAAEARGVEFAAVKAISDEVDFDFPSTERFVDSTGQFSEARFALFAALRPWLWPQIIRLARNSSRAAKALCAWLQDNVMQAASSPDVHSPTQKLEAAHRP